MSQGRFEIVQTEPEGDGKQPYFLRLIGANNSDKIVHSEKYANKDGAEGAFIAIARTLLVLTEVSDLSVEWHGDRGYLMGNGWMVSHTPVYFVSEVKEEPPAKKTAAKKTTRKAPAKKAAAQ